MSDVLTLVDYFGDRPQKYPDQYTDGIKNSAAILLSDVNRLLQRVSYRNAKISSGWRPADINKFHHGAKGSHHLTGSAVDIHDKTGYLAYAILQNHDLLRAFGLWMEMPNKTPGWVHLDKGHRGERAIRVFLP